MREPFTEAEIARQWISLSGRRAEGPDPNFLDNAQMKLDTVVLFPPVLEGFKEVVKMFAGFLCGRAGFLQIPPSLGAGGGPAPASGQPPWPRKVGLTR